MDTLKKIVLSFKYFFNDKYYKFLLAFFFIFLILYWGRFGGPIIDCGREAYIPYAMADLGKVLFKDIICIYGPIPYYLNALFVKLFGSSLNTIYSIGAIVSVFFLFGIYRLAKYFLNARLACIYTLIMLFTCVLSSSISNYIFPYSYAIVYAVVFAIFHLIFMFEFIVNIASPAQKKYKYLYLSAFFLSLCLLSKLDFIPCILPFVLTLFKYRKFLSLKAFLNIFLSFSTPFFIVFLILIFQHVTLQNLIFNFKMILNMAHSPSLEYFYTVCTGYFFDFKKTFMFVPKFLFIALILTVTGFLGYFVSKIKNIFLKLFFQLIITIFSLCLFFTFELTRYIFLYIPLLVLIFLILKFLIFLVKKIKNPLVILSDTDTITYSFILFSILFSLKTLFGLFHELYGVYYLPFILLSFVTIIFILFRKFTIPVEKAFRTIGIVIIVLFFIQNFLIFFGVKNAPIKTNAGKLYTEKAYADAFNDAYQFLNTKLKEGDSVLPLPEGLLFNFVLKNDYNFFNTSFTPLDFDAYSENYLIESLLASKPKYIIMYLRSYEDYGKGFLCEDFGQKFCEVINKEYTTDILYEKNAQIPSTARIVKIFERKDDE